MPTTPVRAVPVVAVLAAACLFGTTGTAQELGPATTTPVGVGGTRILLGAAALWAFALWSGRNRFRLELFWRHWRLFIIGGLGVAAYQATFFTGTSRAGVALGTILALGSGPIFAGMIERIWLGQRPTRRWMVATAVTISGGILVIAARPGTGAAQLDSWGIAAALGAGLSYATYAIAAKMAIDREVHSTVALAWPFTVGAVVLAPFTFSQPLGWIGSGSGALMLVHLGVLTVGVAYVLYGWGLRTLATSTAVTLTLAEPLTATLAAVVVLGERLSWIGGLGAALVLAGLGMVGGLRIPFWRWGRRPGQLGAD